MSGLLFAKNVRQLQTYLSDPLPLSDDRLFARRSYEEMLKNLNRRAQARDFDPNASEPRFRALFEAFVEQNLEAETLSRQREKIAAYEQGRTDIKMGIEFGIIPVPGRVAQMPDTIRPAQPVPTPIDLTADEAPLAPRPSKTSTPSRTDTPLSVALEQCLTKRHGELGHDGERGDLGLVVQFMVDQLGDPATGAMTREQLERIERILPDIPDRLGVPRAFQSSLTARYDYARTHGRSSDPEAAGGAPLAGSRGSDQIHARGDYRRTATRPPRIKDVEYIHAGGTLIEIDRSATAKA